MGQHGTRIRCSVSVLIPIVVTVVLLAGGAARSLAATRTYNVTAIELRVVLNKGGDHDPNGKIYVLQEREAAIRQAVADNPLTPVPEVVPLVIRANEGDEVVVNFHNQLAQPASMHIHGVEASLTPESVKTEDFVAAPGATVTYRWRARHEGIYPFSDLGNPIGGEATHNAHGLFGALVVEVEGSTWTDPETGQPLDSGVYADIHHPTLPSFRECVVAFHDEAAIRDRNGLLPTDPTLGHAGGAEVVLLNYRTEPMRHRHQLADGSPAGEDAMMDSWAHGDPSTPILRGYVGDPMKIRLLHGGVKETHVFHLHVYQWRLNAKDPRSTIIDAISIGPGEAYTIDLLYGVGSLQGAMGDAIWHCHLYPHFEAGMWGLLRAHDVLEDGTRNYPDGTPIPPLQPLPGRTPPPAPTAERPGWPLFIPGTPGQKAPRLPSLDGTGREPTQLELAAMAPNAAPGALFVNPAPANAPVRDFNIVVMQQPVTYNAGGWHDPQGRFYVLAEDEEAVRAGQKPIEPLVIRANAGEVVRLHVTNKLPDHIEASAFQVETSTTEVGVHVHLVKFDIQSTDSAANGWNYNSSVPTGETGTFLWYADEELRTVFFHDHQFPSAHQQRGLFAALIVEPAGSTYHHPQTGAEIYSGTRAVIRAPGQPDFREFVLFLQDFTMLHDEQGAAINPPLMPGGHEDPGVVGINYRSEPFHLRPGDPAYVFSSLLHGDPATPVLEAYAGDPVRIRLLQGAQECSHVFNMQGVRWHREPTNPDSPLVSSQTIGISEAFNLEFTTPSGGDRDLLYFSGGVDDLWLGMWGIFRVYGEQMAHLPGLPDRPAPAARTTSFPSVTHATPAPASVPQASGAPVREYHVVAMDHSIAYNAHGDHDPNGLVFVLAEDEMAVRAGRQAVEPLVLRATLGEEVLVRLTNRLPQSIPETTFPPVAVPAPWPASNRVSLHVQKLSYDGSTSLGTTVGFNKDQTVGPGDTIEYRWQADLEGTHILWSFGDVRNHRHRGLFGALVVEPPGATWYEPRTGRRLRAGALADVRLRDGTAFREFVILAHTGVNLIDALGQRVPNGFEGIPTPGHDHGDEEEAAEEADLPAIHDLGHKAFNYRSERLAHRLAAHPHLGMLFSSEMHGDPATPLLRAKVGDKVVIRYAMPGDKPRPVTFGVQGHVWRSEPASSLSDLLGLVGSVSVGKTYDIVPLGGAGGIGARPGDYLYRSGALLDNVEGGMWGMFRVQQSLPADLRRLPARQVSE